MQKLQLKDRLAQINNADGKKPGADKPVVVLVDDDEQVIKALTLVLQSQYTVRSFTNPSIAAVEGARPDVCAVILDIIMPVHDGFYVFEEIRKRNAHVPIIFNSAYQNIRTDEQVRALRPFSWFAKSGNVKEFLQTVASAVQLTAEHHAHP